MKHWPLGMALLIVLAFTWPVFTQYGLQPDGSIRLFGAHYTDSINNIALIQSLKKSVPPENPNFSGTYFTSYHYFVNLIQAWISKYFNLDVFFVYFRLTPLVLISALTLVIYTLVFQLTRSRFQATIASLLGMLSSNLYYLSSGLYNRYNPTPSVAWIDEFSTRLINFQYLSSLVIILTLALLLSQKVSPWLIGLTSGFLVGFKIYAWIIFTLTCLATRRYRLVGVISLLIGSLIGFVTLSGSSGSFPFAINPFWFIKTMYESPDRLNYPTWELARQTLLSTKSYLGITKLYVTGLAVYLFINFGPRLVAFFGRSKTPIDSLLRRLSFISLLIPLFFIQSGAAWNSIQFSYYAVFLLPILTAVKIRNPLALASIWIVLLPGVIYTSSFYAHPPYTARIDKEIIEAGRFLSAQPAGAVYLDSKFTDNAIVSAISGHSAYLGDRLVLSSYGTDFSLHLDTPSSADVKYLFLEPQSQPSLKSELIFSNSRASVYRVK